MRQTLASITFVALSSVVAFGCDASSLPAIGSPGDASAGLRALLGALGGNSPSGLARSSDADSFRQADVDLDGADVDATGQCSGGGTVHFAGEIDYDQGEGTNTDDFDPFNPDDEDIVVDVPTVSFSYTVEFDGCKEDGITVDGTMSWSLTTDWDKDERVMSMTWGFNGEVDFTGAAHGHCSFDFDGSASSDDPESWVNVDLDHAEGTMCGYEADEVLDDEGQ